MKFVQGNSLKTLPHRFLCLHESASLSVRTENKAKGKKIRVCYLISLMKEQLPEQDKDKWKEAILKHLNIDEDYYKSKYREPVSDLPSIPNQKVRQGNGRNIPITRDIPIYFYDMTTYTTQKYFEWYFLFLDIQRYNKAIRIYHPHTYHSKTLPNFASFENRKKTACAQGYCQTSNHTDDEQSQKNC